jgi:hypothetical protein
MAYIGNPILTAYSSSSKQVITGDGGLDYTLSELVSNVQEIEVFVNNVRQEPGVAYTLSGSTLQMTGAVSATDDFYVIYQGKAVQSVTHPSTESISATDGIFSGDVSVSGQATGTVTAENDGSFDMAVGNYFTCTPTADINLTFTNETTGQSGMILLSNTTPYIVTVDADVHLSAADLTAINTAGTYLVSYYCPDGINVYVGATPALTEGA